MSKNTDLIYELENGLSDLQTASAAPISFADDLTPMPDGNGTVASRYAQAIDKLEICWIALLAGFKTESQQAAFAQEVDAALTPPPPAPETPPAPTTAAPPPIQETIQPKPHRPRQNPLSGHWE